MRWQVIAAETRWLQEVYPFDAVLARELGIPDSAITFHPTRTRDPIYTLEAEDASGTVILRETFDPRYVVRPFFDLFPEYEQVRVTTGWITATSAGDTLVDRRVVTDPERFWDRLQTETYQEIIEYVMDSQDGDPSGDAAPYFDEFRVDLRLSEPNHRIGVDEETITRSSEKIVCQADEAVGESAGQRSVCLRVCRRLLDPRSDRSGNLAIIWRSLRDQCRLACDAADGLE